MTDPSNEDAAFSRNRVRHELLPLCAEVAGRDPVPLLARQAGVLRDEVAACSRPWPPRRVPDPADARSRGRRRSRAGPAGPAGRGCAPPGGGGHPPSLAEVERVLAVARGEAVGTELAGGRRVRRRGGRLRVERAERRELPV